MHLAVAPGQRSCRPVRACGGLECGRLADLLVIPALASRDPITLSAMVKGRRLGVRLPTRRRGLCAASRPDPAAAGVHSDGAHRYRRELSKSLIREGKVALPPGT